MWNLLGLLSVWSFRHSSHSEVRASWHLSRAAFGLLKQSRGEENFLAAVGDSTPPIPFVIIRASNQSAPSIRKTPNGTAREKNVVMTDRSGTCRRGKARQPHRRYCFSMVSSPAPHLKHRNWGDTKRPLRLGAAWPPWLDLYWS